MSFNVTIIRHAETEYNRQHLIHSHSDGEINETGIKQAELLGAHLASEKYTRVYSSDMERTKATARGIFGQSIHPVPNIVLDNKLRERSFGEWDGLPGKHIYIEAHKAGIKPQDFTPPGGETFEESTERLIKFFNDLCSECENSNVSENVLIVTHGLWIIQLFHYLVKSEEHELESFDWDLATHGAPQNTSRTVFTICKSDNTNYNNNDGIDGNGSVKRKIVFSTIADVTHLKDFECIKVNYNQ